MFNIADATSPRTSADSAGQPSAAGKQAARPSEASSARLAQSFSNIVAVLMRDRGFRNLRLADLEWLVVPPVLTGQWRLAHSKVKQPETAAKGATPFMPERDLVIPVATVLWASVSPKVNRRLCELDKKLALLPDEWATGDILWLVAVAGDIRAMRKIVTELRKTEFDGRPVNLRTNGPDGKPVIETMPALTAGDDPKEN